MKKFIILFAIGITGCMSLPNVSSLSDTGRNNEYQYYDGNSKILYKVI
ncbi:MAG: hypothetical protein PSX81_04390 [bacterium]|nr:hypothetical protein [bacterium]